LCNFILVSIIINTNTLYFILLLDVIKDVNRLLSIKLFCLNLYNYFRELLKDNRLYH